MHTNCQLPIPWLGCQWSFIRGSYSHPLLHPAPALAVACTRKQLWQLQLQERVSEWNHRKSPTKNSLTIILQSCRCSQPVAAFAWKTTTTASIALGCCNAVIPSAKSACIVVHRSALNAEIHSGEAILSSRPFCDALAVPTMFRKISAFSRRLRCRHNVLLCRRFFLSCRPGWSAECGSSRTSCPRLTK